jgi:hypothetical protein
MNLIEELYRLLEALADETIVLPAIHQKSQKQGAITLNQLNPTKAVCGVLKGNKAFNSWSK